MARKKRDHGEPIIIKKYANRRLYNTETSSYVTLDHLADMIKSGEEFVVRDAKTGEDITRAVLTQIIFEKETREKNMLPISFLRQLISLYGDSLQAMVPSYLQSAMEVLTRHQEQIRSTCGEGVDTGNFMPIFEELTRQNLALFEQSMRTFTSGPQAARKPAAQPAAEAPKAGEKDKEIADLQAQLAALKEKVDALSS
ncbi:MULTISPECIES: polyhydroxyalkanoate synthesis repressor PhaR [Kordiimonas]|uniref:Polyhydroxyalkanoate synthesis repressor PhaR n=1 Tax=Kordiimonas lacus TaxID=637679 RepID=A0A1G6XQJ8_9PROT|nr:MULTISPECIES: polyhydroxyalkanoate synthesis repressor PhaR [Kordiimonas]SDD80023.1 polyhydroxyalkanoate synthesis repressor PhaR [Kordiimonas lacus]